MTARRAHVFLPLLATLAMLSPGLAHADDPAPSPAPAPAPAVRPAVTNAQANALERDITATGCDELRLELAGTPATTTALAEHLHRHGLPGRDLNLTAKQEQRLIKAVTDRAAACGVAVDDRSFGERVSDFVTGSLGISGSSLMERLGVKLGSGSSEELSSAGSSTLTSS